MNNNTKKLEISPSELEIIANALETQTKILRMQVSAGGQEAKVRLNEVNQLLATVANESAPPSRKPSGNNGLWGLLRCMGSAF